MRVFALSANDYYYIRDGIVYHHIHGQVYTFVSNKQFLLVLARLYDDGICECFNIHKDVEKEVQQYFKIRQDRMSSQGET